jgi:hypothetical protein
MLGMRIRFEPNLYLNRFITTVATVIFVRGTKQIS